MQTKDRINKDTGATRGRNGSGDSSEMDHLAETVNEDEDAGVPARVFGQTEDEVHRDRTPTIGGDGERLKGSRGGRSLLGALADLTTAYVFVYEGILAGPIEVATQRRVGFVAAAMTTRGSVVILVE